MENQTIGTIEPVPQPPPNVPLRVPEDEKEQWKEAAKRDGYDALATWIKWLVRRRILAQEKEKPE